MRRLATSTSGAPSSASTAPGDVQYGDWLGGIFQGDFGDSLSPPRDAVAGQIAERLPNTIEIGLLTVFLAALASVPVGIVSAVRRNSGLDYSLRAVTILGISVPNFWTGTLLIIYAVVWFDWNPIQDYVSFTEDPLKNLSIVIFPAVILAYASAAYTARIVRSSMLEVFYSRSRPHGPLEGIARARSRLPPCLSQRAHSRADSDRHPAWSRLGGAIVAETIFAIPGIGRLTLEALLARDYPVILATVMIFAAPLYGDHVAGGPALYEGRPEDQVLAMAESAAPAQSSLLEQEYAIPPRQRFNPLHWARREPAGALGVILILIVAFGAGAAAFLRTTDPQTLEAFTPKVLEGPSSDSFFGTDRQGKDVWSSVLYAGRISLEDWGRHRAPRYRRRNAPCPYRWLHWRRH